MQLQVPIEHVAGHLAHHFSCQPQACNYPVGRSARGRVLPTTAFMFVPLWSPRSLQHWHCYASSALPREALCKLSQPIPLGRGSFLLPSVVGTCRIYARGVRGHCNSRRNTVAGWEGRGLHARRGSLQPGFRISENVKQVSHVGAGSPHPSRLPPVKKESGQISEQGNVVFSGGACFLDPNI